MNEKTQVLLDVLCNMALDQWGFDPQMDMVIEEMSELTQAILKYRRNPSYQNAKRVAEETTDVKIVINQLDIAMERKYPEFPNWVQKEADYKISRLEEMLKKSYSQP